MMIFLFCFCWLLLGQVRPYPRRAFGVEESAVTLDELGLTNKQEALFLELV
jgi:hypothetical protein